MTVDHQICPDATQTERFSRGQSVPPSASRRYAKAPAAARVPAETCREFPLSRPL